MQYIPYRPLHHYRQVAALWERALGETYPVTDRVLYPRIVTRNTLEPGDGLVALDGDRLIGFGLVEVDRSALQQDASASIQALVVDPDYQRRSLGSTMLEQLEARLRPLGLAQVRMAGGPMRFWSGVPNNLPAAHTLAAKHGYAQQSVAIDLCGPLADFTMTAESRRQLADAGAAVVRCTHHDVGPAYDFLTREYPGWRGSFLSLVTAGDAANILLVKHDAELIGCIQTYPPQSRFRGANLVWECRYGGEAMGGFGTVLIAQAWRGKGLGMAMIQAAAQYIKDAGAATCYIDWSSHALAPFYARVGTSICMEFGLYGKTLA